MTQRYVGRWAIARRISGDEAAGAIGCRGTATLRQDGAALRYDERVTLRLGAKLIAATRTYRFRMRGGSICATFADGSAFFELALDRDGCGGAIHRCGPDVYALTLRLRDADRWTTRWDVSGTKEQRIITRYARLPEEPAEPNAENHSTTRGTPQLAALG